MDPEDLEPPRRPAAALKADLEALSVEEIEDHIRFLEDEITRAREALEARRRARQGAAALFGGGA